MKQKPLIKKQSLNCLLGGCLSIGLLFVPSVHAQLVFTIENPGVEQSSVPGVTTETFDTAPLTGNTIGTYNSPIGTFSGGIVVAADIYGGAGNSDYYAVGVEQGITDGSSSATLTLNSPQDYLGLWWSAGDPGNVLSFFDGATLIGTYDVGNTLASLPGSYFGNPTPGPNLGGDAGEPFAYLNFTTLGTTQITSVQFAETTGGGFEMDNISVLPTPITPPGNPVPDATNSGLLLLIAVGALSCCYRHKRTINA
jgi:hypothetical protein